MINALWIIAGIAAGVFSIISLKYTVDRLGNLQPAWALLSLTTGMVLRLSLVTAVLLLALRQGIVHALCVLVGFVASRWLLLRHTNNVAASGKGEAMTGLENRSPQMGGLEDE